MNEKMIENPASRQYDWLGLTGDVCVVTGAVGGMGTAICGELAKAGARLALVDVSEEATRTFAVEVAQTYGAGERVRLRHLRCRRCRDPA